MLRTCTNVPRSLQREICASTYQLLLTIMKHILANYGTNWIKLLFFNGIYILYYILEKKLRSHDFAAWSSGTFRRQKKNRAYISQNQKLWACSYLQKRKLDFVDQVIRANCSCLLFRERSMSTRKDIICRWRKTIFLTAYLNSNTVLPTCKKIIIAALFISKAYFGNMLSVPC